MEKNYQFLKMDINKPINRKLTAIQYDNKSRYILVNVFSNFMPYDLTYATVKIYGIKGDKTVFFNNAKILDAKAGKFEIDLTEQCLSVVGDVEIQILILGPNQERLSSNNFILNVKKNIIESIKVTSQDEWGILTEGLSNLAQYDVYKNNVDKHDREINTLIPKVDIIASVGGEDLQQAINNCNGVLIIDKHYIVSDELVIPSNVSIKGSKNGEITFKINSSTKNAFNFKGNNSSIKDLKINIEMLKPGTHGGYGNGIVIGRYQSNEIETYNNITIENVEINKIGTNRGIGNCMAIFNGCNDIKISNITLDGGDGILMHWSGDFNEDDAHSSIATKTFHPNGISISNLNYKGKTNAIYISGGYNIDVNNVKCRDNKSAIQIFCGDYADKLTIEQQAGMVGKGIKIKNITAINPAWDVIEINGYGHRSNDNINSDNKLESFDITIDSVFAIRGDSTPINKSIIYARDCCGVTIKNIISRYFAKNTIFYIYNSEQINIDKVDIKSDVRAIVVLSSKNVNINNSKIESKNVAGSFPVYLSSNGDNNCFNISISKCFIKYGESCLSVTGVSNLKIDNNNFSNCLGDSIKTLAGNYNVSIINNVIEAGGLKGTNSYDMNISGVQGCFITNNTFYKNENNVQFNILVNPTAKNVHCYNNFSHGLKHSDGAMIYQGTRELCENYFYSNVCLEPTPVLTFKNYFNIEASKVI